MKALQTNQKARNTGSSRRFPIETGSIVFMNSTAKRQLLPTNLLASPLAVHLVNGASAKKGALQSQPK